MFSYVGQGRLHTVHNRIGRSILWRLVRDRNIQGPWFRHSWYNILHDHFLFSLVFSFIIFIIHLLTLFHTIDVRVGFGCSLFSQFLARISCDE